MLVLVSTKGEGMSRHGFSLLLDLRIKDSIRRLKDEAASFPLFTSLLGMMTRPLTLGRDAAWLESQLAIGLGHPRTAIRGRQLLSYHRRVPLQEELCV